MKILGLWVTLAVLFGVALPAHAQSACASNRLTYPNLFYDPTDNCWRTPNVNPDGNLSVDTSSSSAANQGVAASIANAWPFYLTQGGAVLSSSNPIFASITALPTLPVGSNTIGAVNVNGTVPVSGTLSLVGQRPFAATLTITRPANTTAYAAGQVYSTATSGLTAFSTFALGVGNSTRVQITTITLCDSNGTASTHGQFGLFLFSTASPSGGGFNDAANFAPTSAALAATGNDLLGVVPSSLPMLTASPAAYCYTFRNDTGQAQTDASGNLYAAVELLNAYTPASAEAVTITVSGTY